MAVTSASSIASSLGIGSGVDMAGIANQLAEAQFAPRAQRLTERSEQLQQRISLAGSIRGALSQFAAALGDRVRTGDLASQPSISNPAVARVSSPAGSVGRGSFALEVTQLAKSQTLVSGAFASATALVGAGTLTIRFGATDANGFTPDPNRGSVDIAVPAGATLSAVATSINTSGAGVTAYVAQSTAGAQLVIKGAEGRESGFTLVAAEDAASPGLAALAWGPGDDPARLIEQSRDAHYTLDGLARTSATNAVANAAPGLSLALTGTNSGAPATIGFAKPGAAIAAVMQDMVGALNEIAGQLRTATDPMTGELARDAGARGLARNLAALGSRIVMPAAAPGAPRTLTELGLATERDGSFRFDAARLTAAMARDPDAVAAMFTNGINGVFAEIDRLSRNSSLSNDPGALGGSIARYQAQATQITVDLATLAEKREAVRTAMVARFAAADTRVTAAKSTLTFLQGQIDVWNAQRG